MDLSCGNRNGRACFSKEWALPDKGSLYLHIFYFEAFIKTLETGADLGFI